MIGTEKRATGLEPATSSLGSWHSTTELRPLRIIVCPSIQQSRESNLEKEKPRPRPTLPQHAAAVPSALEGLTAVFGMGTGVAPPPLRPGKFSSRFNTDLTGECQAVCLCYLSSSEGWPAGPGWVPGTHVRIDPPRHCAAQRGNVSSKQPSMQDTFPLSLQGGEVESCRSVDAPGIRRYREVREGRNHPYFSGEY